ncbi:MAG: OmpA family protein [Candidatus Aminicenantes bacterium]|nr:OmpA family protein [Candidatus Aminicenantes bacterium]
MKNYYGGEDMKILGVWPWMPLFISLGLVLLTLFIFLTTFAEKDKVKIDIFKRSFKAHLLMPEENRRGGRAGLETDMGQNTEPIRNIVNRMKSRGINKKLMDEFLTLNQVKDLEVIEGLKGVCVILPEVVTFREGKKELSQRAKGFLSRIAYLVYELPYLVEIKGYAAAKITPGFRDPLEFSAKRAAEVYNYFLAKEITPEKLKVSGCGDAFANGRKPQDKVEIIFKEAEL